MRKGDDWLEIKLSTLSENASSKPGFAAEWGLSIFVQTDAENILFDTGAGFIALHNADKLGIQLQQANHIVLSHAHADHTGGLRDALRRTGKIDIVAHPAIWELKYTKRPDEDTAAYIGVPYVKDELELFGANFILSPKPIQLTENIWTTGEIPMVTDFEFIESIFYVKENGILREDTIPDDLALILKTDKGLVIVLGCGHRGIINTIYHAQRITAEERIHTIVGGTHLFPKSEEQQEKALKELKRIGVQKIGVSHCTGFDASMKLSKLFGDKFFFNHAGTVYRMS